MGSSNSNRDDDLLGRRPLKMPQLYRAGAKISSFCTREQPPKSIALIMRTGKEWERVCLCAGVDFKAVCINGHPVRMFGHSKLSLLSASGGRFLVIVIKFHLKCPNVLGKFTQRKLYPGHPKHVFFSMVTHLHPLGSKALPSMSPSCWFR